MYDANIPVNDKLSAMPKHNFDITKGSQEVFRLLMDALANPARPVNLNDQISQFVSNGKWLAPALTLLDNETGFFWDGPSELEEEIHFLTGAMQVPPESADFIFLSSSYVNTEPEAARLFAERIISCVKAGTHRDPHDSVMIFIASSGKTDISISVSGPGVPPEGRKAQISAAEAEWIKARDKQQFEYPRGVELVFIRDDNSFLAITRKVAVKWLM